MIAIDYTLQIVVLGAATLGATAGALGTYAVLRGQSLLGDAIAHAALPGIILAFLLTGTKAPFALVLGAGLAGWVGTLVVMQVTRQSRIPFDGALGIVLSVFFGFGLVLLTYAQRLPDANQAGLTNYLFGQAAALLVSDVQVMAVLALIALGTSMLLWKEFKILVFDPDFAATVGYPVQRLDIFMTTLLVVAIVIGLQTVGVVLMSALLIAPAAAARQWTDRLGSMFTLAALFGAASGVAGAVISATAARVPTGPSVVLCAAAIVLVSLLFAPRRGLIAAAIASRGRRRDLRMAGVLEDLYTLSLQHENPHHGHPPATLRTMTSRPESVETSLAALAERGWVKQDQETWCLTEPGLRAAERFANSRQAETS